MSNLRALPSPAPTAPSGTDELARTLRRVVREERLFTEPETLGHPAAADALAEWGVLCDLLEGRAGASDVACLVADDFTTPQRRALFVYLLGNANAGRLPDVDDAIAELAELWECDSERVRRLVKYMLGFVPANLAVRPAARAARLAELALLRRELSAAAQVDARARALAYMSPERLDPAALRTELRDAIRGAKR